MRRWTPAIVFATALAVRVAIALQLDANTALFRTPQLDSVEYLNWAQRIASGDFTWPAAPSHGSGYPLFLGLLLFVCRGSLLGVHLIQAGVGALTAVMISAIAFSGGRAAAVQSLAAGLFAALYGPLAFIDVSILAEGFLVFLLSASLLAMIRSRPFFAGTALGLAIIVRPTAAILIPVFLWFAWRRMSLLILAVSVAYPVLPVIAHNWATTGDVLAIQSGGGMNFSIGNSPQHDGTAWARPGGTWDWLRGEAWRAGVRGAVAEDRYYMRRTFAGIIDAPGKYVALLARKLAMLTQSDEIRDSHSYYFFTERSSVLRWMLPFSVLFPFAAFGVWNSRRELPWLLIAYSVAITITLVVLVIGSRYRIPLAPALCVFAGLGVQPRRFVPFAIFIFVVFALTKVWHHAPSHDLSEEWAMDGIALGKERQIPAAYAAFSRAQNLDLGWTGKGDVDLSLGKLPDAAAAYERAMTIDPHNERAYAHLALVRAATGDRQSAVALLRRAIAIKYDREALYNLAGFLFAAGQFDEAERCLREILRADDSDTEALTGLTRVQAARKGS